MVHQLCELAKGPRPLLEHDPADHAVFNPLVRSLTLEQRRLLGDMLLQERLGGIHDVLAALTDWMSSDGLAFTLEARINWTAPPLTANCL